MGSLAPRYGDRKRDHPALAADADSEPSSWPARPGSPAGWLRGHVKALGDGGHSLRAAGENRADICLTLPQTKGEQTDTVTVPLPYGDTELSPLRTLELWQLAAVLTKGKVFRRIWLL